MDEKGHRIKACVSAHIAYQWIFFTLTIPVQKQYGLVVKGFVTNIAFVGNYPRFIGRGLYRVTYDHGNIFLSYQLHLERQIPQLGDHSIHCPLSGSYLSGPPQLDAFSDVSFNIKIIATFSSYMYDRVTVPTAFTLCVVSGCFYAFLSRGLSVFSRLLIFGLK
ncbi:hypothetical protein DPMN_110265 [Dreissena polymorpha]|uniref:Uncharacterized protein n=1 Tax=Dreissena polymorpha TaxID=45954 RepID=A0A9D4KCC3_DREPO|nr:hypothetical protein DPMN_110265 [Dreissena polymorpha]